MKEKYRALRDQIKGESSLVSGEGCVLDGFPAEMAFLSYGVTDKDVFHLSDKVLRM